MATRTLRALIRASGYTPAAGMSLRNHVAGARPGVAMSHYRCDDWNRWSSTSYTAGAVESGTIFNWSFSLVCGPAFFNIMRPFSEIYCLLTSTDNLNNIGGSAAVVGGALSTTGTSSIAVQLYGVAVPAKLGQVAYSGWADYAPLYIPPDNADHPYVVSLGFAQPVLGGPDYCNLHIVYPGDTGNFNDELRQIFPVCVERRVTYSTLEVEWYSSSDYGNPAYLLQSGGLRYEFMVGPTAGQRGTLYIRYRPTASTPWQYIITHWSDTRF